MTSPQPPTPHNRTTAGAVNEETLHLPLTTPGPAVPVPGAPLPTARTAPSPYPPRPAFRAPPPPPPGDRNPRPTARPRPQPRPAGPERWEGLGFRPDIQGLRAVAVVLVLLSHAGFSLFSGGYVGVDVFFVLSGFLITSLLVKEVFDTGKISIAGFYARRARRILPAATVVTIATVIGAWLWLPVTRIESAMRDAFTVIVYVVNYRFIAEETEYLNADQMPSPFQQYWSLAVEEQFYLVWPLLLIGLMFLVGRSPRKLVGAAVAACAGIFAISLVLSALITQQSQPTAYYAAHTRAWELAGGALLALTLPTWRKTPKVLGWFLGIAGLAAILASGLLYDERTPFPGYTALLPVLGTMLVIIAGSGPATNPVSALLTTKQFQFVGKISYSLYLWHWPILILIPLAVGAESSLILSVCLILGTFALAQLTYQYIEEPVRRSKLIRNGNIAGLTAGVVCSVLGIAMILTFTVAFPRAGTDVEQPPVDLNAVEQSANAEVVAEKLREGLAVESVPDDLTPSLEGAVADRPEPYDDDCHAGFSAAEPDLDCVYGATDSEIDVVLFGDSHAAQWFPAVQNIADERGWRLLVITKSACTPVSVRVMSTQHSAEYAECWDWKQNVFDSLEELRPELVIVASEDATRLSGVEEGGEVDAWRDGWTATLERLTSAAASVTVLSDTPRATTRLAAPDCLGLHLDEVRECVENQPYAVSTPDRRAALQEAAEAVGVELVDTEPWFCIDSGCPLIVDDLLVYRDSHHMTTVYARSIAPVLAGRLPDLAPQ